MVYKFKIELFGSELYRLNQNPCQCQRPLSTAMARTITQSFS